MVSAIEKAIVKTLIYADIFDYPLTQNEIFTYLINIKDQRSKIKNTTQKLKIKKIIYEKDGYYFLRGKSFLVNVRKKREKWSREKLRLAKKVANILRFVSTVQLVGVSGALAVNNSKEVDDIDLLIVSKSGLLWTTRFLVTIICELLSVRRRPGDVKTNNKICLNMFVDENHLSIPKNKRDLFSAHEVIQMKPVYDSDNNYQKFLTANQWVEEYLPNALNIKYQKPNTKNTNQKSNIFFSFLIFICNFAFCILHFAFVENILKNFQLWYMKSRRTTEIIKDGIIRFHPHDARVWVMKKYDQKISFIQHG